MSTNRSDVNVLTVRRPVGDDRSYVYVIEEDETGRIKIGKGNDPAARREGFQIGNSHRLRLVDAIPGSYPVERGLQGLCRDHALPKRREWFAPKALPIVLEHIRRLRPPAQVGKRAGWVRACLDNGYALEMIVDVLCEARIDLLPPVHVHDAKPRWEDAEAATRAVFFRFAEVGLAPIYLFDRLAHRVDTGGTITLGLDEWKPVTGFDPRAALVHLGTLRAAGVASCAVVKKRPKLWRVVLVQRPEAAGDLGEGGAEGSGVAPAATADRKDAPLAEVEPDVPIVPDHDIPWDELLTSPVPGGAGSGGSVIAVSLAPDTAAA